MAYKTAEIRHAKQAAHDGSFSLKNKLRQYLRTYFDKQSLLNCSDDVVAPLIAVARDYDAEIGEYHDDSYYADIAQDVIKGYISSAKENSTSQKEPGAVFGKSWKNIANTLTNFKY